MSVRLKEETAVNALRLIQTAKSQSVRDYDVVRNKSAHKTKSES